MREDEKANTVLMAKIDILLNLINFTKDISAIKSDLAKIGFDSESELVTITQNTIANILNRVIDKEISYDLLEEWANLIECREDIERKICMILDEIKYERSETE